MPNHQRKTPNPVRSIPRRPPFGLEGQCSLELSTQVLLQAAQKRGLHVEVLERSSNTVRLRDRSSGHSEIVVQATKTSADSYVCTEIMSLKNVTKRLLSEAGLRVPRGRDYQSLEQALADWPHYQSQLSDRNSTGLIVKPNSTNYGIGISRLVGPSEARTEQWESTTQANYRRALEQAFAHDHNVLIEEFIPGKEYRFLVIGGKLRAVLQRIPANVIGDGRSSIAELVATKNLDPWRSGPQGSHTSPLESLKIGETEREVLREQGLRAESVPEAGRQVFLRHNSNISTGGDSRDMTDTADPGYGLLAERCARTLGARICGVDVMSTDISAEPEHTSHAIIEANFNPVLYFHEYPAEGLPRPVAEAVVALLFPRS